MLESVAMLCIYQSPDNHQQQKNRQQHYAQGKLFYYLLLSFPTPRNYNPIQATLVIRDLTLRVFAITRFRGEKSREKIVQSFCSHRVRWWRDCVARASTDHILPVSVL
jgi:hypothetical protein